MSDEEWVRSRLPVRTIEAWPEVRERLVAHSHEDDDVVDERPRRAHRPFEQVDLVARHHHQGQVCHGVSVPPRTRGASSRSAPSINWYSRS